jgi:hypothetical protein
VLDCTVSAQTNWTLDGNCTMDRTNDVVQYLNFLKKLKMKNLLNRYDKPINITITAPAGPDKIAKFTPYMSQFCDVVDGIFRQKY